MQRATSLALGRIASLSSRRVGSAIRGRTAYQAERNAWQYGFASVRQLHFTRPICAAEGGTFLDRGDVTARIIAVVKNFEKVDPTKVTDQALFRDDLSLDSLDAVEVVMAIEDEFTIEIPDSEADKILSVADAVNFIVTHPAAK